MNLVYGITVCDEKEEVLRLLKQISENTDDKIVVQMDCNKFSDVLFDEIAKYTHKVYCAPFKNDFAEFKNELIYNCISYNADFIFQLDADEMITEKMIKNIKDIISSMREGADLIYVGRKNIVKGITEEHIKKWNWTIDEFGRINMPDFQGRIFRSNLRWINKVHEKIDCPLNRTAFLNDEDYFLIHEKTIERQEKQNERYQNILENVN